MQCLHCDSKEVDGYVMDTASEELAAIRKELMSVTAELKSELDNAAQKFFKQGISERPVTVFRRGRVCIPVKVAFRGQVPKYLLNSCRFAFLICTHQSSR